MLCLIQFPCESYYSRWGLERLSNLLKRLAEPKFKARQKALTAESKSSPSQHVADGRGTVPELTKATCTESKWQVERKSVRQCLTGLHTYLISYQPKLKNSSITSDPKLFQSCHVMKNRPVKQEDNFYVRRPCPLLLLKTFLLFRCDSDHLQMQRFPSFVLL